MKVSSDPGLFRLAPKGFVITEEGEIFPPKTKVFIIANLYGENIPKYATASSYYQARNGFLAWFKNKYPRTNPPRWENIHIFKAPQTTSAPANN